MEEEQTISAHGRWMLSKMPNHEFSEYYWIMNDMKGGAIYTSYRENIQQLVGMGYLKRMNVNKLKKTKKGKEL